MNRRLERRNRKAKEKAETRARMRVDIDPENYEYIPAEKETDYYDNDVNQRVGIYVRVSTDDVKQTTSFELQKMYYEDFVNKHPNWTLYRIYADEGISGTTTDGRKAFNEMIADAKAGKMDLIITKSVSRFARNSYDFIGVVRMLAKLKPRVGVFFESEAIFSLNDDAQMALSFQATIAEEESHTRSRSMDTSIRMRFEHGLPLTPELLGYIQDEKGKLVINPEEEPTVKLIFYMYLYGYSTKQIAETLIKLGRKSYLGNDDLWTSNGVIQILRNERYCGEVLTRKTWTPDYHDHKSIKNKGKKPQSRYYNHHAPIVTTDDFIAVQRLLDNARFRHKSFLPELRVIESGKLKGFVTVNPRWSGFKYEDYYKASQSVYPQVESNEEIITENQALSEYEITVNRGDFDLRGFEVTRSEFFDSVRLPAVVFSENKIKFNTEIVRKFRENNYVELLINPVEGKFAVRKTNKENRQGVYISRLNLKEYYTKDISATAFFKTLFELFNWDVSYKYKIIGTLYEENGEIAYIFDTKNSNAFFKSFLIGKNEQSDNEHNLITRSGKRVRAIPESWTYNFGNNFYLHEKTIEDLQNQSEKEWKLRLQGQLFETGKKLNVTGFEELKSYINQELSALA
ncbi:MAG: recombinase family protein [Clostridiales bacterium]|nr:recombinase family protein [Clostridiales bacterium]